jgi:signal transduction histidine kinase
VTIDMAELPDQVAGFSNHYLLTMLQPLVENAIEGCAPDGTVEITFADHGDAVEFTVANPVDQPVDREVLFAPQSTTKNGHQGLGVSIVSRLAEFVRGELTADITDTGVRMRVLLPRE